MSVVEIPKRNKRSFISEDFKVENWEGIKPYYDDLLKRNLSSKESLIKWFHDRSELEAVLSEDAGWRYIRMTCDTASDEFRDAYTFFITEIEPKIAPISNQLNKMAMESPFLKEIDNPGYDILIKNLEKDLKIFREKNTPLKTEISQKAQEYGAISGAMTVEWEGKEITLQQAGVLLQSTDRAIREQVYHTVAKRRLEDKEKLDALFSELISLRHKVAENADFDNFRDYMFTSMGRFDYSPNDCFEFHNAVQNSVVPLLNGLAAERKGKLKVDALRPWDKAVDPSGKPALKPFQSADDLV